jgi:hypothetical protein
MSFRKAGIEWLKSGTCLVDSVGVGDFNTIENNAETHTGQ